MKILVTTDVYLPHISGVVSSVTILCGELIRQGHDVRILTLSDTLHSYRKDNVYYVGAVNAEKIYPGIKVLLSIANEVIRDILDWGPGIVHSQCEFSTFIIAHHIAKKLDIPLVHTYHTIYESCSDYVIPNQKIGKFIVRKFSKNIVNKADRIIAPSEKTRQLLKSYGVFRPIEIVPTGIDLELFHKKSDPARLKELKKQLHIPPENRVIIFVGRLAKEKNIEELVLYHSKLRDPHITLLIVGDGPHKTKLEECVKNTKANAVFTGIVQYDEIADYYRLGDIFVSASTSETQGLTYIESLACGVPTLCRKDPCLAEVITDGVNGWQYENFSDFKRKLFIMLYDKGLRNKMSKNAKQIALAKFSAQAFVNRLIRVYHSAIEHSKESA